MSAMMAMFSIFLWAKQTLRINRWILIEGETNLNFALNSYIMGYITTRIKKKKKKNWTRSRAVCYHGNLFPWWNKSLQNKQPLTMLVKAMVDAVLSKLGFMEIAQSWPSQSGKTVEGAAMTLATGTASLVADAPTVHTGMLRCSYCLFLIVKASLTICKHLS